VTEDPAVELSRAAEELASVYLASAKATRDISNIGIEALKTPAGDDSLWAVDGSHTFLLGVGGRYLAWVRAVALHYEIGSDGGLLMRDLEVRQEPKLFDIYDETDDDGPRGRKVSEKADHHRHRLELSLLGDVARRAGGGLVALDGALAAPPSGELSDLLRDAVSACESSGAVLVGVSKDSTSRLLGSNISDEEMLRVRGHADTGFVRLPGLAERQRPAVLGDSYFARLHPSAVKWFRVDVASAQPPADALGRLARFSADGISPGYPFPLLEAHRTAVLVRQMQPQLRELALQAAARAGMPADQLALALTDAEGRRAGEFHVLLDEIARVRK